MEHNNSLSSKIDDDISIKAADEVDNFSKSSYPQRILALASHLFDVHLKALCHSDFFPFVSRRLMWVVVRLSRSVTKNILI